VTISKRFTPGPIQPTAPTNNTYVKGKKLWAIEAILDSRRKKQKGFQYHMLWRGSGHEETTWESLCKVINAHVAIKEYEKRYSKKPKPTKQEMQTARLQAEQDVEEPDTKE
jgi:hypothetical protein